MNNDYCNAVKSNFGLTMPVLLDPTGAFPALLGTNSVNDWHMVLDASGTVAYRGKGGSGGTAASSALNTLLTQ